MPTQLHSTPRFHTPAKKGNDRLASERHTHTHVAAQGCSHGNTKTTYPPTHHAVVLVRTVGHNRSMGKSHSRRKSCRSNTFVSSLPVVEQKLSIKMLQRSNAWMSSCPIRWPFLLWKLQRISRRHHPARVCGMRVNYSTTGISTNNDTTALLK